MGEPVPSMDVTISFKNSTPAPKVLVGEEMTMGRSEACDIVIDDRYISSRHGQFKWDGSRYHYIDLGSSNGSWVNDNRVDEVPLSNGDEIAIGETRIMIHRMYLEETAQDVRVSRSLLSESALGDEPGLTAPNGLRPDADEGESQFMFEHTLRHMDADFQALREQQAFLQEKIDSLAANVDVSDLEAALEKAQNALQSLEGAMETLERNHQRLNALHAATAMINRVTDLKGRLNAILDLAIDIMKADCGFLLLYDEKTDKIQVGLQRGMKVLDDTSGEVDVLVQKSTMPSLTIAREVLNTRQTYATDDLQSDGKFDSSQSIMMQSVIGVLCVPMIFDDQLLGLIYVDFRDLATSDEWTIGPGDRELFEALASLAATTIQNAKFMKNVRLEVERRSNLQRYLAPELVEQVVSQDRAVNLETARRSATILFCDIRSFTTYAENTEPDQLIKQLNMYFTVMLKAIAAESGSLDKFLGDGLMAFFGPLLETEQSERAAVRAAIEMQRSMKGLNDSWRGQGWGEFQIGIGINAGEVVAGNLGSSERLEYTVIGDVVNTASRLSGVAKPRQILVSESVAACLAKTDVQITPLDAVPLKGKSAKVPVFEINY